MTQPGTQNAKPFTMPADGKSFTREVIQRCEDMIGTGIWKGVEISRFRSWTNNFETETERYLSARLLDRLHYRSQGQTKAMMNHLFQSVLPEIQPSLGNNESNHWIDRLASNDDPGVRLVPVINQKDPPTKSGPLVCRLLKRLLGLNDRWMIWPEQIPTMHKRGIKHFLFVDDFVGTGIQFWKFFRRVTCIAGDTQPSFSYLSLAAYERGVERLQEKIDGMPIGYAELLDESHNLFGPASSLFDDGENDVRSAVRFYRNVLSRKNVKLRSRIVLGYSKLSLAYAFDHATPNSTLPIFWTTMGQFHPLFTR